ncbi:MAG: PIN domain-containing protein [Verrucomicrobiota bacterium]
MIHGIDTDFLVAVEIVDHPFHRDADQLLQSLLDQGHEFALAPQTLAEFIHIVTDSRRVVTPLTMTEAIAKAEFWWDAEETVRAYPTGTAVEDFFEWLRKYKLGRKRLLDTMLAATFHQLGVSKILTNNGRDYKVLGQFEVISFRPD